MKFWDPCKGEFKGFLEIYQKKDNNLELLRKSNLIVYDGREIFPQILFNTNNPALGAGQKDFWISWMSVGSGGCDPGDPLLPLEPDLEDHTLAHEIVIDLTDPDCTVDGHKKKITSVEFLQDLNNNNRYVIAKSIMVITRDQCNGLNINEAGLWFADTANPGTVTTFKLASRITFPTIYKTSSLELILAWYYYM